MFKKVALTLVVLFIVAGLGLAMWARSVLSTDAVRTTLADQLSKTLGQRVTVEGVRATIYPRVTLTLSGVAIGNSSEIKVGSLDVGTDFRALLSRRIEHAALHVNNARMQLPLPPLSLGSSAPSSGSATAPPVELVSVDEVVLSGIEIVSRGRTLRGDIEMVPHGTSALTLRRIALTADTARIDATGEITDLAGPVGTLDAKAGSLDLDQLTLFASDFMEGSTAPIPAGGATTPQSAPTRTSAGPGPDLTITISADRATMAGLTLETVKGKARLHAEALDLEPMTFNLFGGTYAGSLGATFGNEPTFSWKAALKNVDVAAVTAFAGSPGMITGRLAASVDISGSGIDAASAMKTARGTARVTITDGVVQNLALVRSAVAATSLDPQAAIASSQGPKDEPFSELGGTLSIAGGTASTRDLHFVSKDIQLDAGGALRLDGSAVTLQGSVQLSEELTRQANPSIVRVAAQGGRITLPATVRGSNGKYAIELDAASLAKRALTNEAKTQGAAAAKKAIGRYLPR